MFATAVLAKVHSDAEVGSFDGLRLRCRPESPIRCGACMSLFASTPSSSGLALHDIIRAPISARPSEPCSSSASLHRADRWNSKLTSVCAEQWKPYNSHEETTEASNTVLAHHRGERMFDNR